MREAIISSSVLIVCIILLRRICKGKISAKLQYALWLVVALRLTVPGIAYVFPDVLPESKLSIMNLADQIEEAAHDYIYPIEEQDIMFVQDGFSFDELPALTNVGADGPTAVFVAGHVTWTWTWADWAKRIWYIGMAIVAAWMLSVNIRFFHQLYKSRKKYETDSYGLSVYLVKGLSSPCLYGLPGKQAVYLPEDVAGNPEQIKHILAHEYCHYKHRDILWTALRCILLVIYWFHPLIWVAAVMSKQDCELASDEAAIKLLGEEERIAYGKTLLSLISRRMSAADIVCTATTMTAGTEGMKERIQRIVQKPRRLAVILIFAIAVVGIVAVFTFTQPRKYPEGAYPLDRDSSRMVTTNCFEVTFPESFIGKAYYRKENDTDIIVYHEASDREIGRFCMMPYEDAIQMADEREIILIGKGGSNSMLRSYMDGAIGDTAGEPQEKGEISYAVGEDVNSEIMYIPPEENISVPKEDVFLPGENIVGPEESMTEESGDIKPIPAPEDIEKEMLNLPFAEHEDSSALTPIGAGVEADVTYHHYYVGEDANADTTELIMDSSEGTESVTETEESRVYLPGEKITEVYIPKGVPCYLYIPADYTGIDSANSLELVQMNQELTEIADLVVILNEGSESMMKVLDILVENRSPYIGDAVKTSKIASALPVVEGVSYQYLELETEAQPYGATLYYQSETDDSAQTDTDTQFLEAVLMFAAIENLDYCNIRIKDLGEENGQETSGDMVYADEGIRYERKDMEEIFGTLYPYSESKESMVTLYNLILDYLEKN